MNRAFFAALLLTSLTTVLASPPARAQSQPAWNWVLESAEMVHPPGTPPGTYDVRVAFTLNVDEVVPGATDLSRDLVLYLNDGPIGVLPHPVITEASLPPCFFCNPNPCRTISLHGAPWSLLCGFVWSGGPCGCGIRLEEVFTGGSYNHTDTVRLSLEPTVGSMPEIDTSDDSFTLVVGENDPSTPFCSGDGTLPTPCPCGNSGTSGRGCANSANPTGALLEATGFTEPDLLTGTDSVVLHGSGMPATSSAIYLKSDGDNGSGVTFGDGVSCLTGSIIRLRTKFNVGGASRFPEPGDPSLSVRGATPPGSGLTGWYQVFYRNAAAAYCPPATHNISSGLRIDW